MVLGCLFSGRDIRKSFVLAYRTCKFGRGRSIGSDIRYWWRNRNDAAYSEGLAIFYNTDAALGRYRSRFCPYCHHSRSRLAGSSWRIDCRTYRRFLFPTAGMAATDIRKLPFLIRENEVLKLIASGKNSTEIGELFFLSLSTVKREVSQIFDKLGVNDRPQAVSEAIRQKLLV